MLLMAAFHLLYCIFYGVLLQHTPIILNIKAIKMKITFITLSVIITLSFASCGNTANTKENTSKTEDTSSTHSDELADAKIVKAAFATTDAKLNIQVQDIYKAYLGVQSALATDKSAEAAIQAMSISKLVKAFDAANLPADQKQAYESQVTKIQDLALSIGKSQDIKIQRTTFAPFSDHVYELVKAFGNDRPIYQAHCPMALNGKGASWLSDKTEIKNPYYGSEMLECGGIINVVKK